MPWLDAVTTETGDDITVNYSAVIKFGDDEDESDRDLLREKLFHYISNQFHQAGVDLVEPIEIDAHTYSGDAGGFMGNWDYTWNVYAFTADMALVYFRSIDASFPIGMVTRGDGFASAVAQLIASGRGDYYE